MKIKELFELSDVGRARLDGIKLGLHRAFGGSAAKSSDDLEFKNKRSALVNAIKGYPPSDDDKKIFLDLIDDPTAKLSVASDDEQKDFKNTLKTLAKGSSIEQPQRQLLRRFLDQLSKEI